MTVSSRFMSQLLSQGWHMNQYVIGAGNNIIIADEVRQDGEQVLSISVYVCRST